MAGSDDWWVIYPSSPGAAVSVTVSNGAQPNASCAGIGTALYDTTGTRNKITSASLNWGNQATLVGQSGGSDRYWVEVAPDGCTSGVPYTITLNSGGGGTPPSSATGHIGAGTGIGDAWPPLQGGTLYSATLAATGSEDWYVLYKKPGSSTATIRLSDTTVSGSVGCDYINAYLYGATGTRNEIDWTGAAGLAGNAVYTFSLASTETSDSQGRYYLEITPGCSYGSGETYSIEPEAGAEFASPARIPFALSTTAGAGIATAWPPLQGARVYSHTLAVAWSEDWYSLYKKSDSATATIRLSDTTVDGAVGCDYINAYLYDSSGTRHEVDSTGNTGLAGNAVYTFSLGGREASDSQGRYYLEITPGCSYGGGESYTIEPEPGTEFLSPARPPSAVGLPAPNAGLAWPPLRGGIVTRRTLSSGTSQDWYVLYKKADSSSAAIWVSNTTEDGTVSCPSILVYLYDYTGKKILQQTGLSTNQIVTYAIPGKEAGSTQGRYYLEVTSFNCSSGGQGYSIDPEPGSEWYSASTPLPSGASRTAALGPISGYTNYTASVGSSTAQDWSYFIARAALTVRVWDTSGPTAACNLAAAVYSPTGSKLASASLSAGQVAYLKVPKAGTYYLELSTGGCAPKAPVTAFAEVAGSAVGPVLKVASTTLKAGTHGASYSATISVSGGKKPYAFTAVTSLPSGLALNKATGAVTGKPARKGTYSFTVTITDSTQPAHNLLTVLIHLTIS